MATNDRNAPPAAPTIYHFTHMDNLPSLKAQGCLWSDAETLRRNTLCTTVGMSDIKKRRRETQYVTCHPGTLVGQYVPFYFCPRSVMLYVLNRGNAPGLHYHGGQRPLVHLEADLHQTIQWAQTQGRAWAFSDCNAAASYALFYNSTDDLHRINWQAVRATQWSDPTIKEGKQAEFLLFESFPWSLVRRIGVIDEGTATLVKSRIGRTGHVPPVVALPEWYY